MDRSLSSLVAFLATLVFCDVVICSELMELEPMNSEGLPESERVIFGTPAQDGQFPWTVALLYKNSFVCTASIVSPSTVLTAAHCVKLLDNGNTTAPVGDFAGIIGTIYRNGTGGTRITFSKVTPHPGYNPSTIADDIAIFTTTEAISFTDKVKSVCLAKTVGRDEIKTGTVMGWGRWNDLPLSPASDVLRYAELQIKSWFLCFLRYPGMVTEKQLCGDGLIRSVCNGDSGGPLVHLQRDVKFQIGITSFGRGLCANLLFNPGVFTRVASYVDWVISASNNDKGICTY